MALSKNSPISSQNSNTSTQWNLSDLFAGDDDPQITTLRTMVEQRVKDFARAWKDRADYLEDPQIMRVALDQYEDLFRTGGLAAQETYYYSLRFAQDQTDSRIKAKMTLAEDFAKSLQNEVRFFEHAIAKIPEEKQHLFLESAELAKYRRYLKTSFARAKHLLTEPEEKILSMVRATSYSNWVDMVEGFLNREERDVLDRDGRHARKHFNELFSLLKSTNKEVRDAAAEGINDVLSKYVDVAEAELNSVVNYKKSVDKLRNMDRPDRSRHIADDVDTEVVDAALDAVEAWFSIPHRYYKLKAQLLGVPKLAYHERNVDIGEVHGVYTWEYSKGLIRRVFQNLDPKFLQIFDKFDREGRFDVFPRKGKSGGAFCAHSLISHPTYILLNHTDTLYDVLVLAHEVGHGINNELIKEKQHALYFGTPTSTAEVASTFMEDFVFEELYKSADDETKLSLAMLKLDEEIATIFRQVACYRFEQELHAAVRAEGYLDKKAIGELFKKHMSAYMGPAVEQSPGSENWWMYWSHIRRFFYVYSYATGMLISKSLGAKVRKDPGAIEGVKMFLAAGCSAAPREIFASMGVDITEPEFWTEGLKTVELELQNAESLAKSLGKVK